MPIAPARLFGDFKSKFHNGKELDADDVKYSVACVDQVVAVAAEEAVGAATAGAPALYFCTKVSSRAISSGKSLVRPAARRSSGVKVPTKSPADAVQNVSNRRANNFWIICAIVFVGLVRPGN